MTERSSLLSSVRNAARALKEFQDTPEIGVSDLARRLGVAKSTAHRILTTLTEESLVEQDPLTGGYRLSPMIQALAASASARLDLASASGPVLEGLRVATRQVIRLATLEGLDVIYVDERRPSSARAFPVVEREAAVSTSAGRLLLAALPSDQLEDLLLAWRSEMGHAVTDDDQGRLLESLARIRAAGWSEGVRDGGAARASLAAPVRSARGDVVAAVMIACTAPRVAPEVLRSFARPTVEAAATISRRLGYREPTAAV